LLELRDGTWVTHPVAEIAEHFRAGRTNEITLLAVRQSHVLILLPERLLQLVAEGREREKVGLLRRADQTSLGTFAAMMPAHDGGLWISGTRGFAKLAGPLRSLKPGSEWLTTEAPPPELKEKEAASTVRSDLSAHQVFDVAVETDDVAWFATADGLFRRAPAIWEVTVRTVTSQSRARTIVPSGLPDEIAKHADWQTSFSTRNGDLWLGAARDIAWRHKNSWRVFSSTNQIGPEEVVGFAEAPDGRVWCATPNKVWEFDGRNWLAVRGGFDRINGLCGARDGALWVATDAGLARFTRGAWVQNDVADGLPSARVTDVREEASGQILAATADGLSAFQPEADEDPPRTFIRPLSDREQTVREGAAVRLAFGGRDKWNVTAANRLLFSYRLDEREWSPFQEGSEVTFTDLPVGKHYFQVRAMDRNANLDPKPARLEFAVVVPWYRETRLVLILSVALAVAVFFAGLAFNRHRKLQRSYAEVERQVAARTRELELANRELLHSQKMNALGTLAAGIAHDFNNILSIVRGSAQIIEDNPDNPEKIRTRLDRIKTVVQQGAGIVEAMLGFSRNSGERAEPCDVNAVVDDTIKLLGDRFLREVGVEFQRGEDLPEISVARDFVQQVLLNFIFNAAEAMTERKHIALTTRLVEELPTGMILAPARAASFIAIAVKDSGGGIAAEVLPRVFEPFFTTKAMSAKRGTGLGLSMVYELAKKLEAGLTVETALGTGSTFTIFLPVKTALKTPLPAEHAAKT
jgi:signal transduction histidine kinase